MTDISTVGVLGCGLMGSGIAQTAAAAGFTTIVREVSDQLIEKGKGAITGSLNRLVEKGKLEAGVRDATLGRLRFTTKVADLRTCDIVVEAVVEDLEMKRGMSVVDQKLRDLFGSGLPDLLVETEEVLLEAVSPGDSHEDP